PSAPVPMAVVNVTALERRRGGAGAKTTGGTEKERETIIERADVIVAANEAARRYGVRAGQKVAEARALVAHLLLRGLSAEELRKGLARVADVALGFGPTVSIDSGDAEFPFDTVWVDVTGTRPLWGSEKAVVAEMSSRIRDLGHRARIAVAEGPRLARAA